MFLFGTIFWAQPILAGPKIGGEHSKIDSSIFTNFCILHKFVIKNFKIEKRYLNLSILLILSSFHHKYSIIKFLEIYNGLFFALLSLIISIIVIFILNKNEIQKINIFI